MTNGFDTEMSQAYVDRLEAIQQQLDSEKGTYMQRCRELRADMAAVLDEAKEDGLPKKLVKIHVNLRKLEKQKEAMIEALGDDDAETFDLMAEALGDYAKLPLGMAALNSARQSERADRLADDSDTLNDMVGDGE